MIDSVYPAVKRSGFENHLDTKVEKWFADWGYWVIFANRFLSGTRSVVSIFAGLFHLNAFTRQSIFLVIVFSLTLHRFCIACRRKVNAVFKGIGVYTYLQ